MSVDERSRAGGNHASDHPERGSDGPRADGQWWPSPFGAEDERGMLNLITDEKRRAALAKLRDRFESGRTLPIYRDDGRRSRRRAGVAAFDTAILASLYDKDFGWPNLADALELAKRGDGTLLQLLADSYNGRRDDGTTVGEDEILTLADEDAGLTSDVRDLVSAPTPEVVADLGDRGVEYVVLSSPADGRISSLLDATAGPTRRSKTLGTM